MSSRASTVERGNDALFVKDGSPVKFCFHRSVKQGRGQITRDVEQRGGEIVSDEREAQVLLVDEQEDIAFLRRRYYSSTALYRLSIYVEPRGFVQKCIRSGTYKHVTPTKQKMPGRPPRGGGRGVRIPFTDDDRNDLAYYLATRLPTRDGRMGNNAYKELERLGQSGDEFFAWATRHTWHSWREHYKKNMQLMDTRISAYVEDLKHVGHHLGHDVRSHDHRQVRLEDEDGDNNEEEEERQDIRRQRSGPPEVRLAAPGEEQELQRPDEEGEGVLQEEEAEALPQELQRAKRRRVRVYALGNRGARRTHTKRARVSGASSNDGSDSDAGHDESIPTRENDDESSEEIEGSDLFGDRDYGDELHFALDDARDIHFPMPYSPRASLALGSDGAPLSTQATLVASPLTAHKEKGPAQAPGPTPKKMAEAQAPAHETTIPPTTQERVVAPRARVRGASAQPGPSVLRGTQTQNAVVVVEAPYRNTRSRSRSVEPRSQLQHKPRSLRRREDRGRKGKGKATEEALMLIEEDVQVDEKSSPKEIYADKPDIVTGGLSTRETFEDEMLVEGLLQANIVDDKDAEDEGPFGGRGEDDEISDADEDDIMSELPPYQDLGNNAMDSDDAETHGSLVRGSVQELSAGESGDGAALEQDEGQDIDQGGNLDIWEGPQSGEDQVQEQDENEDSQEDSDADAERIERMARGTLQVLPSPAPAPLERKVTRSKGVTQTQSEIPIEMSPRRTRSGRARAGFPSPGTKARAVFDRLQDEERHTPYEPPAGSRAARAVRARVMRM